MSPSFSHLDVGTPAAAWTAHAATEPCHRLNFADITRIVIVCAHPDDESLGAGGLISAAVRAGLPVSVVIATVGNASHPASPTHSPEQIAQLRAAEALAASDNLGLSAGDVTILGLPDGHVAEHTEELLVSLVRQLGSAAGTLLAACYSGDGHPDHEAVGRVARTAAGRCDAQLVEFPIWFYPSHEPAALPWGCVLRLPLDAVARQQKQLAIASHVSQVAPLSPEPGDEAIVQPHMLAHFSRAEEWFLSIPAGDEPDAPFEQLHRARREPWRADSSWYEQRKRAITTAVLPQRHYVRGLEVGCSTGWLAAELAARTDQLTAIDESAAALDSAAAHVPDNVELLQLRVPGQWPAGRFDLIVVSETAYFLSPEQNAQLIARIRSSLSPAGTLLLCDWRHEIAGWPLRAADIHAAFAAADIAPEYARYNDDDIDIVVFAAPAARPDAHAD